MSRMCVVTVGLFVAMVMGLAGGCTTPLERSMEQALRERLAATSRLYQETVADARPIQQSRDPSEVEADLTPQRLRELDTMSGPGNYADQPLDMGQDLLGAETTDKVVMPLEQIVRATVENNLGVAAARLQPAIGQARVQQAEAVFDAIFFLNVDYQKLDIPRPPSQPLFGGGLDFLVNNQRVQNATFTTGIRKTLTTGAQVVAQTELTHNYADPSQFVNNPNYDTNVLVQVSQPLLRNFGSEVNRAQIVLSQSAAKQDIQNLRRTLMDAAFAAEQAYWDLVLAIQDLKIRTKLYRDTQRERKVMKPRLDFDVSPATYTDVVSREQQRNTEVITARTQVRRASDVLKRLMNSPDLPLTRETLILPADAPADAPVTYSLLDGVTAALRHRPEVVRALLQIDDASVLQRVADNARLPVLNVTAGIRYNAVGEFADEAYARLGEGDFIDYLVGAQFETPIGNRGPEALYTQRRLERQQAVIAYQNAAQQSVLEVKDAQRNVDTAYRLIGATQDARRAAADALRALQAQEDAGQALTPEFINLKLDRQQTLANTEFAEVQALTNYHTAVAQMFNAMGTILERNQVEVEDSSQER